MQSAQQNIDKVARLLKVREMFLAVARPRMAEAYESRQEVARVRAWNIER